MKAKRLTVAGEAVFEGQLTAKQDVISMGHFYGMAAVREGMFNQVNGITTIPHNFGAPSEYSVSLTPMVINGKVGEFGVKKYTDYLEVINTGEEVAATFELMIFKIKPSV